VPSLQFPPYRPDRIVASIRNEVNSVIPTKESIRVSNFDRILLIPTKAGIQCDYIINDLLDSNSRWNEENTVANSYLGQALSPE
jgi:hypothetical protein